MTPAAGLDALTPSHAVRCHLVLDSGFVEAITVSRRRASRSNCVVASEGSLAHPLLSPCHTLCATVTATRDRVRRLARQSCCDHGAAERAEGWKQPLASPRWLAGDDPSTTYVARDSVPRSRRSYPGPWSFKMSPHSRHDLVPALVPFRSRNLRLLRDRRCRLQPAAAGEFGGRCPS